MRCMGRRAGRRPSFADIAQQLKATTPKRPSSTSEIRPWSLRGQRTNKQGSLRSMFARALSNFRSTSCSTSAAIKTTMATTRGAQEAPAATEAVRRRRQRRARENLRECQGPGRAARAVAKRTATAETSTRKPARTRGGSSGKSEQDRVELVRDLRKARRRPAAETDPGAVGAGPASAGDGPGGADEARRRLSQRRRRTRGAAERGAGACPVTSAVAVELVPVARGQDRHRGRSGPDRGRTRCTGLRRLGQKPGRACGRASSWTRRSSRICPAEHVLRWSSARGRARAPTGAAWSLATRWAG